MRSPDRAASQIEARWDARRETSYDGEHAQWTVPVNVVYSKVLKFGNQLTRVAGGARYYVEAPDGGPEWGLRLPAAVREASAKRKKWLIDNREAMTGSRSSRVDTPR